MMSPDTCGPDTCSPGTKSSIAALAFSSLPFLVTFGAVGFVALHKLFPLVSGLQHPDDGDEHYLPSNAPGFLKQRHSEHAAKNTRRRIVAGCFSTTIALATVLAELILCEISNALNPEARAWALKTTVPTLLFFLVVVIPFLEISSIVTGAGGSFKRSENGKFSRKAWTAQTIGFALWLSGFWWLGKGLPGTYIHTMASEAGKGLSEACLERVGIIGISLMALLSGFAAVSTPWHTLGSKSRPVTESDVERKQAGLDATNDMLAEKKSRLRLIQRKVNDKPKEGFMTKVIGTIRGSADAQEIKSLELEISGLSSMALALSSSLSILQNRRATTERSSSTLGKLLLTPFSYALSLYCIFRIATTAIASLRRHFILDSDPAAFTSSTTDPINRVLSILAKHVDPSMDQLAWSRQISFLLSGMILLLSFNSVLQTFHMLTKLLPSLLYQTQASLALIIAQISATYVISSALLLRSNLPTEMKSVVSEALGSPLEPGFVDRWFDGWFLLASFGTAVGIFLGRKIGRGDLDDWEEDDIELGQKMS